MPDPLSAFDRPIRTAVLDALRERSPRNLTELRFEIAERFAIDLEYVRSVVFMMLRGGSLVADSRGRVSRGSCS